MPTFSHEPEPSAWPPLPPTVSDLTDDDLDFLVNHLLSSDDELGEDSPDVAPAFDGSGEVIPFPTRYSWWRMAAVVVLIVGGVGSSFFIPGLFGKTSAPNSNSAHLDADRSTANRSNTAVTPHSQPPSTKRSNVDLIAMTSEQQAAAKKAFSGSTDLSNLDVPVAQCLSTINMAHSPVLGAAPVETAQPAEAAQPASPRTESQLLILGAPLRIVVVEHTCSHGESSVLFRSTLSHGERTG
ncbi:hypothetical protein [Corynebacterium sp.]|uniref:hypothetical protein n=1 Tax=Corynebacterium sp. TaxID=1720 RepID=UPI0026DD5A2A|nr:hypothetical protein [Corynebacterium sp.]MDO4915821.1 hypothetical protein [Corynebacterium sp.]